MVNFRADIERYGKHGLLLQPSLWAILVYRFGRWTLKSPKIFAPVVHLIYFVGYSIIRLITGVDIPRTANIGPGLMIHHFNGVFIHPSAQIGKNCTLRQGVSIGVRHEEGFPPRIGDNFVAGAYAQILGDITIDNDVQVGALSLMMQNGEAFSTYVGIPARKI